MAEGETVGMAEPEGLVEPEAPEPDGAGLAGLTAVVMGALIRSPLSTQ